jgi:general secretion pathway protein J
MGGLRINEIDRSREAGFTLVELLVAIALLSFVSVALFGSLRFGMMAWSHGQAHTEQTEHIAGTQNLLRRLIADAYPLFLSDDPTRPHVAFDGTSRSVSFLAPVPIALGAGGRSRFSLSVDQHSGRGDLVIATAPELADGAPPATAIKKTLLAGLQAAEFAYFGRTRSDRVAQWHDDWSGESTMPELVRLRVRFATDDARRWPELIVAPRIAVDVGCAYDTLTRRCRGR